MFKLQMSDKKTAFYDLNSCSMFIGQAQIFSVYKTEEMYFHFIELDKFQVILHLFSG
jgi:hypothetical protein